MTGSYSCMTLLSTLIFDTASLEQKTAWVEAAAKLGEGVVARRVRDRRVSSPVTSTA